MNPKKWLIIPALILAMVAGALVMNPRRGAGAQEPQGIEEQLALQDVWDAGPPAHLADASTEAESLDVPQGRVELSSHQETFTYQGFLTEGSQPANGTYDLRFLLYDAEVGGSQVGDLQVHEDVPVSDGLFTVVLDFGAGAFDGSTRYLEIAVRPGASSEAYTVLAPRRPIRPTPYATFAYNAETLDGRDSTSFASANHNHDDRYYRKRQRTQFSGSLTPGQTRSWFTFGWPTDEIVYWAVQPTTVDGRVDWTVDVRLTDNDRFTYYITVTNRGSVETSFDAKYVVFR